MSRRHRSVVTVLSGGLSLSLGACSGKEIQGPTNPPIAVAPDAAKGAEPGPGSQEGADGDASNATATDEASAAGDRGGPSGRTPGDRPVVTANPPPPPPPTNPPPAQPEADQRLPVWDEVESAHPEGATNPPRPVLELLADGSRCWKAWEGGMRPPDEQVVQIGGRILADPAQTSATEIECPRRRVQSVLDRKAALDAGEL